MFRITSPLVVLLLIAFSPSASGEKANMSPEKLRESATHVITGTVSRVYQRGEKRNDWQYTHYVAEVRVKDVEKGDGIDPDRPLYARYWKRRWIGKTNVPPSTSGHRGLPAEGDTLRIYLARDAYDGFTRGNDDGGFNVIGANGFETLPKATAE